MGKYGNALWKQHPFTCDMTLGEARSFTNCNQSLGFEQSAQQRKLPLEKYLLQPFQNYHIYVLSLKLGLIIFLSVLTSRGVMFSI